MLSTKALRQFCQYPSLLAISLFLFPFCSSAQVFGGDPASLKWKQINTDTVRVIFPYGMEAQARRTASVVHSMAANQQDSLGNKLYKINIVLQNQTTIANGYVGLGPFRSEFQMTPSLNNFELGSINWTDALATHEYRHVQQFNNFRNGGSKLMYYLFGEEGLLVATGASVPDWFYEGDAVYNETRLSQQGRGRLPNFLNRYPSLWQAGKNYSWMKLRNGSLKDYVPSHYELGYLLVNYGHEKYGNDFWRKVTQDASAFRGLFYPMQKAVKKYAGVHYKTFVKDGLGFYKQMTGAGNDEGIATQQKLNQGTGAGTHLLFPVNNRYVINDYFPYQAGGDSVFFLRSSYRRIPAFYVQNGKNKKRIRMRDISIDEQYSYRNGNIVYAAYKPDIRWGYRDYSELRLLDTRTGKQRTLTHKSKYFTPDLSPNGQTVVAVQMEPNGASALHLLQGADGKLLKALPNADDYVFTDPKFIDDNTLVSAVRLKDGRMALARINTADGQTDWLTPPSYHVLGYPQVYEGMVYYTASYNGNDELYAVALKDKRIFHISHDIQGNYFVNRKDDSLVYSRFSAEGYQLIRSGVKMEEVNKLQLTEEMSRFPVAGHADGLYHFLQEVPPRRFSEKRYSKTTGLFNFHSWRPYYEDPYFTFSLYGENVLNTLQSEIYYQYDQNEKTNALGFSEVFAGWFPYLSIGSQLTFQRQDSVGNKLRQWNQLDSRIGISFPLDLSGGKTFKYLTLGTNYFLRNEFNTGPDKQSFSDKSFTYLHHFITWSQQRPSARQHIFPRFANSISLQHRYAVTSKTGYQFIANAAVYLPGLLQTHNLVLSGGFQQRDTANRPALFGNRLAGARGYNDYYFSRMWKLSANYHFPLWLPDWGFGNILYISRVRANAFYDMQRVYSNDKTVWADKRSAGGEIYFDTKWWNQYELSFGFRVSHLLDNDFSGLRPAGTNFYEFILPVSIIPK